MFLFGRYRHSLAADTYDIRKWFNGSDKDCAKTGMYDGDISKRTFSNCQPQATVHALHLFDEPMMTKVSDAELGCFIWSAPEQTLE